MNIKPNIKDPPAIISLTGNEMKTLCCQIIDVIEHSTFAGIKNCANTSMLDKFKHMLDEFLRDWGGWEAEEEL